jgi:hypothetical protein
MRRAASILAAVLALVMPAAAAATSSSALIIGGPGTGKARQTQIPVRVHGALTVRFGGGDPAPGCPAAGTCAYSGRVTWEPPSHGTLYVIEFGRHHKRVEAFLAFDAVEGDTGHDPVAQVQREDTGGGPGVCGDLVGSDFFELPLSTRGREVDVGLRDLAAAGSLHTRCAGPLGSDLAPLLPSQAIRVGKLRRGRMSVDLTGKRDFSTHGFTGDVASSLVLDLLAPDVQPKPPSGTGQTQVIRRRVVTARYAVERLAGTEQVAFAGLADGRCGPFDACGAFGGVALSPAARAGSVVLEAEAAASRPGRDLRAALGLAAKGRRRGVHVYGHGSWSGHGRSEATVTRSGAPTCRDSVELTGGDLAAGRRGSTMRIEYLGGGFGSPSDPLRTRCPGPVTADLSGAGVLAGGAVPLRTFRNRHVTVVLGDRGRLTGEAYMGTARPDLTLVLRRTSVREHVVIYRIPIF